MELTQLLERHWKTIAVSALVLMVSAAALSFVRPLEYSSSTRLFIVLKKGGSLDPYTAIRSAERTADTLSQVIYTAEIFDKVMRAGFSIDGAYFRTDDTKRRKQWARMVSTQVTHETGFLQVSVYHQDKKQASEIARAISYVLSTEGNRYVGGQDVEIRVVDTPVESRFPVRPNVPLNAFLGAVIGVVLSSLYIVVAETRRRPVHHHGGTF
jgi:capsular polysaccharide biosynthesis protein